MYLYIWVWEINWSVQCKCGGKILEKNITEKNGKKIRPNGPQIRNLQVEKPTHAKFQLKRS